MSWACLSSYHQHVGHQGRWTENSRPAWDCEEDSASKQKGGQWHQSIKSYIPVDEQSLERRKDNKGTYEILNASGKQCDFPALVAAFLSTDRQVDPVGELISHSDI